MHEGEQSNRVFSSSAVTGGQNRWGKMTRNFQRKVKKPTGQASADAHEESGVKHRSIFKDSHEACDQIAETGFSTESRQGEGGL